MLITMDLFVKMVQKPVEMVTQVRIIVDLAGTDELLLYSIYSNISSIYQFIFYLFFYIQDQPRERRTQNCCCVSARSSCPNSRNQNSGGNGAFLNAASPRIKGANDNQTTDDLDGFVSTRIVNNVSLYF